MQLNIFFSNLKTSNIRTRLRIGGLTLADGSTIDSLLFSENFPEHLKAIQAVEK